MVEGAGAVPLAALVNKKVALAGKTVALVLTGGNIDVNLVSRIIERGLVKDGRLAEALADSWAPTVGEGWYPYESEAWRLSVYGRSARVERTPPTRHADGPPAPRRRPRHSLGGPPPPAALPPGDEKGLPR